jgi:hypothetical protein
VPLTLNMSDSCARACHALESFAWLSKSDKGSSTTGEVKAPSIAASFVRSFGTNEATGSYGFWTKTPTID